MVPEFEKLITFTTSKSFEPTANILKLISWTRRVYFFIIFWNSSVWPEHKTKVFFLNGVKFEDTSLFDFSFNLVHYQCQVQFQLFHIWNDDSSENKGMWIFRNRNLNTREIFNWVIPYGPEKNLRIYVEQQKCGSDWPTQPGIVCLAAWTGDVSIFVGNLCRYCIYRRVSQDVTTSLWFFKHLFTILLWLINVPNQLIHKNLFDAFEL